MIRVYDVANNSEIGTLNDTQFQFLVSQLEEEGLYDKDYYINRATIDMFEQNGADAGLVKMLRDALGQREDMDIRYVQE